MSEQRDSQRQVVIIGGGPSGLTAAYELTRHGACPTVLERAALVGGLSRTESYKGFHFDMGGHRFFTKAPAVRRFWHEILANEFLRRPRLSRIYYKKRYFNYPLKPLNALWGLGPLESILIVLSYVRWHFFPYRQEDTFEQWVTNRFGKRLFLTFFKTYTEKVWGIPCSVLRAEWAAQRIKDLSLRTALLNMFFEPKKTIKTLIDEFDYPRLGPGMMWEAVRRQVEQRGGSVRLGSEVTGVRRTGRRIDAVEIGCDGRREVVAGTDFISSMPVTEFIKKLEPPAPTPVLEAAAKLHYRDFLTVCLVVNKPDLFPDNWIYIHDPDVKVGRIQNFKNWSPDMVPDPTRSSLGLEYFCSEGDALWTMADADLVELGKRELEALGLVAAGEVEDGCVFRVPKSYPVYDADYRAYLATVREFVDGLENFQTVGRNGLHRYNNQDHAMLTGMLAVRNLMLGERHDLWAVNTDQEYHEEIRAEIPEAVDLDVVVQGALSHMFAKLDRVAFGTALGLVTGLLICLATIILVLKGGDVVGPNLQLLSQFFPGYEVSFWGSVIALGYGFVTGFAVGWLYALIRNATIFFSMVAIHRRAEAPFLRRLLDHL